MELRSYARTKRQMDAATSEEQMPKGAMARYAWAIKEERIMALMAARKPR